MGSEDWKIIGSCVIVLQSGLVFHPKILEGEETQIGSQKIISLSEK